MYLGSVDERGVHVMASEILNNALDEAMTGHASMIEITLQNDSSLTIADNGRGVPVELHLKFPGKSALEVIFTTLHSGGKFREAPQIAHDRLHGAGAAVVNALSDRLWVEVARPNHQLYRMSFAHGKPTTELEKKGEVKDRRGTTVCFHPDPQIFGNAMFKPATLYLMAQSIARSYGGVEVTWKCDPAVADEMTPTEGKFHFPNKF
ncbi:MAG: hypothetical protein EPN97_12585 [Alphaproteobacteria bacterium]|nr:MAG: hypothetical protein EPN97_12585 [Alphaproteobacteria bacterium]